MGYRTKSGLTSNLYNPPASASWILGLQAYVTGFVRFLLHSPPQPNNKVCSFIIFNLKKMGFALVESWIPGHFLLSLFLSYLFKLLNLSLKVIPIIYLFSMTSFLSFQLFSIKKKVLYFKKKQYVKFEVPTGCCNILFFFVFVVFLVDWVSLHSNPVQSSLAYGLCSHTLSYAPGSFSVCRWAR